MLKSLSILSALNLCFRFLLPDGKIKTFALYVQNLLLFICILRFFLSALRSLTLRLEALL